jgi:predicted ATPase
VLKQVVDLSDDTLQQSLARLRDAEFIYEQPAFLEPDYTFKHALTQEVAYNSMLGERRKGLHERTAQAIETLFHQRLDDQYSELASHYSRSGNTQKAVDYLQLAGQQSEQRSAYVEAVNHLTVALEMLKALPDTPERARQELGLQIALGVPLIASKGYAVPEVEKAYARAWELCQQMDESPQSFSALWGLWAYRLVRAEFAIALELAEQLLRIAQKRQEPLLLMEAHHALGDTFYSLGDFTRSREHAEKGITFYASYQQPSLPQYASDAGVSCRSLVGWDLFALGYPDQALSRAYEAVSLAKKIAHPFSLGWALVLGVAFIHQRRREAQETQACASEAIVLSSEYGFTQWLAWGNIMRGWALVEQGQEEEGFVQLRQGLADAKASGSEIGQMEFSAMLAEAYGKIGQPEEGRIVLDNALAVLNKTSEHSYEAEVYRLKGELTLQSQASLGQVKNKSKANRKKSEAPSTQPLTPSAQAEAEACFLKALEISRQQQAKSLELRAAMSLARLWQSQGKQPEARTMLANVYNWFTEGFDTKDLQEAKALLEVLDGKNPKRRGEKLKRTKGQ